MGHWELPLKHWEGCLGIKSVIEFCKLKIDGILENHNWQVFYSLLLASDYFANLGNHSGNDYFGNQNVYLSPTSD